MPAWRSTRHFEILFLLVLLVLLIIFLSPSVSLHLTHFCGGPGSPPVRSTAASLTILSFVIFIGCRFSLLCNFTEQDIFSVTFSVKWCQCGAWANGLCATHMWLLFTQAPFTLPPSPPPPPPTRPPPSFFLSLLSFRGITSGHCIKWDRL